MDGGFRDLAVAHSCARLCVLSSRHGLIWGYHSRNLARALGIESGGRVRRARARTAAVIETPQAIPGGQHTPLAACALWTEIAA